MITKLKIAFLCAGIAGFLCLWSCADEALSGPDKNGVTANALVSDYFRAVYFLDGPLVSALGDYQHLPYAKGSYDAKSLREARDRQNKMLAFIEKKHPRYFSSFKEKVTSGDYSIVQTAVQEGLSIYKESLEVLPGDISLAAAPYIVKPPYVVEPPPTLWVIFTQVIIDTPVYEGEAPAARESAAQEYASDDYVATITTGLSDL